MLPIQGIYEVAVRVHDLARAEKFYCEILGLTEGLRDRSRNWVFLRAGGDQGMIVLQEDKGHWPTQHLAFAVSDRDLYDAAVFLRDRGVQFTGPVTHEWIPARSIYFADPDGHDLELCAPYPRV